MECVEQPLEEIGWMGQVLDVDQNRRETVPGMVTQVIHDAGFPRSSGRREHEMPGAQCFPKLPDKLLAKSQVHRVNGSPGIKFRSSAHLYVQFVV